MTDSPPPAPRVFISYSHTSEAHKNWVRELATRLVDAGVDVELDQWSLKPGQDKNAYMERMVVDPTITHVLVVCDARYQAKANAREGGAGVEGQIISERIYKSVEQRKFLPIVREVGEDGPCTPVFLAGRIYFDFSSEQAEAQNFEQLLRAVYDKPLYSKPTLGSQPRFLVERTEGPGPHLTPLVISFRRLAEAGSPAAVSAFGDYLSGLTKAVCAQKLLVTPTDKPIYSEVLARLEDAKPLRDEFVKTISWMLELSNAAEYLRPLQRCFQAIIKSYGRREMDGVWNESWDDAVVFLAYELWLYATARMLASGHIGLAQKWVRMDYIFGEHEAARRKYGVFRPSPRSIYEWNDKRQSKWLSPIGQILKERGTLDEVTFEDLLQADLSLWVHSSVSGERWWPHTAPYGRYGHALPLYVGVDDDAVWTPLMNFFGVGGRGELRKAIEQEWAHRPIRHHGGMGDEGDVLGRLLNLEKLYAGRA